MEQRNLVIAIVLSVVILGGWMFFVQPYFAPPPAPQQQAAQTAEQPAAGQQAAPQDSGRKTVSREEALAESPRVAIDTPRLKGSIALKGSRIDDLVLKEYRETVDPQSPDVVLLSPFSSEHAYYADFGWAGSAGMVLPDANTVWTADGATLAPGTPVTLTWDNGQGLTFARKFEVDADFLFTISDTITNASGGAVEISPYGRIVRYGTPQLAGLGTVLHEGPIGAFGCTYEQGNPVPQGCGAEELSYGSVKDEGESGQRYTYSSTGGWLGISDKYWLVSQLPPSDEALSANIFHDAKGDFYQVDFTGAARSVAPGESVARTQHLFAGAKIVKMLDAYGTQLNIPLFDRAIDFGLFYWLTRPLFYLLDLIYNFVGNFGIAILCLTVLVKAAMFPLANKSYRSMSKMKLLGPKMTELREKYGDDRAKLNQEMMALYKREKVNPAAGCLPILVQIPVFFALYKVLIVTIEMRHAPFFLWIKDLSAPDPTSIFNLFGLIPWDYHAVLGLPAIGGILQILSIGIWPLIMGFTMWAQMRLNPTPPDPVQARIFGLMPIIFTFMLAHFAAGLVIYWAWNNTLSIAQQKLIMWRMEKLEKKS
jgi:YidC/Oxa1 family membrane protein insertase